jgi:hypothetical protein
MATNKRLLEAVNRLIAEGEAVIASKNFTDLVDRDLLFKWIPGCRNLMRILGKYSVSFSTPFREESPALVLDRAKKMMASLLALRETVENDLLTDVTELVYAEAFCDLLEQAEELSEKGYFLAAGVICRAVFEEHLRKLCDLHKCLPGNRPTIEKLKVALVQAGIFTKIDSKNVDAIAGEGNHCAHNVQPPLSEDQIKGLIQKVQSFLIQHPLK